MPLLIYRYPPQIQIDSLCYQPFKYTLTDPHYPFIYGTLMDLLPLAAVILLQHLMVYISACCLFSVARQVWGRGAGFISAAFIVTYGDFVLYAHSFMSETAFNFFLAIHLCLLWKAIRSDKLKWFFLCGIAVGLATHVRGTSKYQWAVIALSMFLCHLGARVQFRR